MLFDVLKNMSNIPKEKAGKVNVIIISAACCIPGMDIFDNQARKVIDQAISETGVKAKVILIPATTAIFVFKKVIKELMVMRGKGKLGVPAILIDGKVISYGVPQIEDIKAALKKIADINNSKQSK